ncbi:MAG: helicase-associated domain-containing protein [Jatrophihabitans sp.]
MTALLRNRPEVLYQPAPESLLELALRLDRHDLVREALDRLPLPCTQIAEAVTAHDLETSVAALAQLLAGEGPEHLEAVAGWVDVMVDHALLRRDGDRLEGSRAFVDLFDDPYGVAAHEFMAGRTRAPYRLGHWRAAVDDMVAHGFRAPFEPRPIGLHAFPIDDPRWPEWSTAAVGRFADVVMAVLDRLARAPVPTLKSGGIGAREIARLAKAVDADDAEVRLSLALLFEVGALQYLPARAPQDSATWGPSAAADTWRAQPPAEAVAELLHVWWSLDHNPTQLTERGARVAVLQPERHPRYRTARQRLFAYWSAVRLGHAVDVPNLAAVILWHHPFTLVPEEGVQAYRTVVDEATRLGLVAAGGLTALGHALAAGGEDVTSMLRAVLPDAHDSAMFGADLTAVVPGVPVARVSRLLDAAADREGSGGATVWRFTPGSVRRALDEGYSAAGLLEDLAAVASAELPQPLRYLVEDVGRRHGHIRVAPAVSVLRSDDEVLVRQLAGDRSLLHLGLRQLAPTVLVAAVDMATALTGLRAAGYLPMPDGELIDLTSGHAPRDPVVQARNGSTRPRRLLFGEPLPPADPAVVAQRLSRPRAETDTRTPTEHELVRFGADGLDLDEIRLLAHAIDTGGPVTIDYLSGTGRITRRTISAATLDFGVLIAYCHLKDAERHFRVDRIEGVLPAT